MKAWLSLLLISLAAPLAALETFTVDGLRVELLTTREEVLEEYCRTERAASTYCTVPRQNVAIVRFPASAAPMLESHLAQARSRGYYEALSPEDLFHGHFIMGGPQLEYPGPQAFLDDLRAILYHSAEYNERWGKEAARGIPLAERTPRSFVGGPDGGLKAAKDLVPPERLTRGYEKSGTLYGLDIVEAVPGLTRHRFSTFGGTPDLDVNMCRAPGDCFKCRGELQFYLLPDPAGAFRSPEGAPVDAFFRCPVYDGGPLVFELTRRL